MSTFNIDELKKAVASVRYQTWENADLVKFMEHHSDIKKLILYTPDSRLKDVGFVPTKYGMLKVVYNQYIPPNQMYLMQDYTEEIMKPNWL